MARNKTVSAADTPLRRAEPDVHWSALRAGDRVTVRLTPGFETGGFISAVTPDHTVVWVDLDGGRGRTLLHCGDGVEILPD
ncbi:hypothetical protein [Arthrobacter sp. ZGTC131]|uniref:hypothetical protein n=1 Tax=Arthrobacter sp. ZGTC131 TaxID=2058898 RepID=UPI000CE3C91F|nr:hypothetical protein [Arthrobacter sp. ZGTC131]